MDHVPLAARPSPVLSLILASVVALIAAQSETRGAGPQPFPFIKPEPQRSLEVSSSKPLVLTRGRRVGLVDV